MHFVVKKKLEICANAGEFGSLCKSIFKAGLAPFGLALTPNISLVIINLILQGVGDGSQPLMSKYCGVWCLQEFSGSTGVIADKIK